ncbi:MAG: T9SS type A sorting domain-containing protein [Ignavibacteria bacterium]|nr:T9SS type A sorting domain-containing protein [Ignavibacteria bacterium]
MNRAFHRLPFLASALAFLALLNPCGVSQTHELKQELTGASTWFGGDNRPNSRRTVGVGQLVLMDTSMTVNSFSFRFESPFDFIMNPTGGGHEVTLRMHVRNRAGVIMKTADVTVPASFTSGWVTWDGLGIPVTQGVKLFFTAYLVGGFDVNMYYTGFTASASNPYSEGTLMLKDGQSDADLDAWTDWVPNSAWDAAFRLTGTLLSTGTDDVQLRETPALRLAQNHPNPVRSSTAFDVTVSQRSAVALEVYDAAGRSVRTIFEGQIDAGTHRIQWTDASLPNGVYTVLLRSGRNSTTRMLTVLR